jgi:tripartite-type tricarboxylate transporter receptor subunit TctC
MMSAWNFVRWLAGGLFFTATLASGSAAAQDIASFYTGKQVTIVVGASPGGGYDMYARLISRNMPRHIPGNPTVIVSNMPGADSNIAADHIYFVAPKDGTQIGALQSSAVVDPLFGSSPIKHDPSKFQYLGSANNDVYVCAARTDAPVKSFEDVLTRELITGATATSASPYTFAMLMNNVLGTKFKMVLGYAGSRDISLAMENHELEAMCGAAWPSFSVENPGWFESGVAKVLVQTHVTGYPDLNKAGVPLAVDFARTPEQRAILELFFTQTIFGRPYVVAPEVPKDRVAALRQAFYDTLRDPELVAEAKEQKLDVDQVSGDEVQAIVAKVYASSPDLIAKTKAATVPKQ